MIKKNKPTQNPNTTCEVKEHLLGKTLCSILKHKYQVLVLLILLKGENYHIEKVRIDWKII